MGRGWRWLFRAWIVVFTALTFYAISGNRDNIHKIQASRLESCRGTYSGIEKVFKPFFRPPAQQTAKERRDQRKFKRVIRELKKDCAKQVSINLH